MNGASAGAGPAHRGAEGREPADQGNPSSWLRFPVSAIAPEAELPRRTTAEF